MPVTEYDMVNFYFLCIFILPEVIFFLTSLLLAYFFHILMNISTTHSLPLTKFLLNTTRCPMYSAISLPDMPSPSCSSFDGWPKASCTQAASGHPVTHTFVLGVHSASLLHHSPCFLYPKSALYWFCSSFWWNKPSGVFLRQRVWKVNLLRNCISENVFLLHSCLIELSWV